MYLSLIPAKRAKPPEKRMKLAQDTFFHEDNFIADFSENQRECCVLIEMEPGVTIGYGKGVLLNEINALHSLTKAAKTSRMSREHARDLVLQLNREFSRPLVKFENRSINCDTVYLSIKGQKVAQRYWKLFELKWNNIIEDRLRSCERFIEIHDSL